VQSSTVVPPGHLGSIVTSLEMLAPPPLPTGPQKSALKLERWQAPIDLDRYRSLFREIGENWLWQGRLVMDDARLAAKLNAATTEIHIPTRRDGVPVGLLELDFAQPGTAELAYFGMVPGMTGHGHGGWLMAHAMRLAWRPGTTRVWVHTCDFDHPAALGFYMAQGFTPFERAVEILPDPRATGIHPPQAAARIPII
jgi:GNAT superfamily N-acetyltransferase